MIPQRLIEIHEINVEFKEMYRNHENKTDKENDRSSSSKSANIAH
jgi:hypothetical protein